MSKYYPHPYPLPRCHFWLSAYPHRIHYVDGLAKIVITPPAIPPPPKTQPQHKLTPEQGARLALAAAALMDWHPELLDPDLNPDGLQRVSDWRRKLQLAARDVLNVIDELDGHPPTQ